MQITQILVDPHAHEHKNKKNKIHPAKIMIIGWVVQPIKVLQSY